MSTRYSTKVRLGNYVEDEARMDLAAKDFEARRARGDLIHLQKQKQREFQVQPVPMTFAEDDYVHYGDHLQIAASGASGAVLAVNIFGSVGIPGQVRVTASKSADAQARNVFVLEQPVAGPTFSSTRAARGSGQSLTSTTSLRPMTVSVGQRGPALRYGDRVVLACNPTLVADPATGTVGIPFLLWSQAMNAIVGAGRK